MAPLFVLLALCVQASFQKSISEVGDSEDPALVEGEYGDLLEGDIVVTPETRNAKTTRTWPGGRIAYSFDSTVDSATRNTISKAIQQYHSQTCVRWSPRQSEGAYVKFVRPADGCNSPVGRVGREQIINLGRGCTGVGTIVHEMMHAIGFHHEQNRPDREQYVTINFQNIQDKYRFAFNIAAGTSTLNLPYDYSSVMHYNAKAFSKNGQYTIVPKDGNTSKIGRRSGLSQLDVKKINTMYGCSGGGTIKNSTPPPRTTRPVSGGCVDTHSSCYAWAVRGECQNNPNYMLRSCKKSCQSVDNNASCSAWAQRGECRNNVAYMQKYCRRSCGFRLC